MTAAKAWDKATVAFGIRLNDDTELSYHRHLPGGHSTLPGCAVALTPGSPGARDSNGITDVVPLRALRFNRRIRRRWHNRVMLRLRILHLGSP
jgi:hypothetical protein